MIGSNSNEDFDGQWATDAIIETRAGMEAQELVKRLADALSPLRTDELELCEFGFSDYKDFDPDRDLLSLVRVSGERVEPIGVSWHPSVAHEVEDHEHRFGLYVTYDELDDGPRVDHVWADSVLMWQHVAASPLNPKGCDYVWSGVYGIVSRDTSLVVPVTDDSVILVKTYHSGRDYEIQVRAGEQWREQHRKYALFYRNDPKEDGLVEQAVAELEFTLRVLIAKGANALVRQGR